MRALEAFKSRYADSGLRDAWHRYAPRLKVSRTFLGARVYMNLRDNIDEFTKGSRELETREWPVLEIPRLVPTGDVWDVGANVGLFSVSARRAGHPTTAFEFSPVAARLLAETSSANGLGIHVVDRAFTVEPVAYDAPASSDMRNALEPAAHGGRTSITYAEAASEFGTPTLLKMDIEGGEAEFFASGEFKRWILDNRIIWLVEVHSRELGFTPEWTDVPHRELASRQYLYCGDAGEVDRIAEECARRAPGATG